VKTFIALVGLLAAGAVGFTLVGCGSENAVSLGKPGSGAATTTAPEQTGTQKSNVSLEVWFSRDKGLVAVPDDTRLLGIAIHNGLATVDLTSEYQSGGGALSMQTRLGQVVYTLTQFPTVQRVRFRLDGEPVNVFSSEGIVLKNPVGRSDYADLLPAITVDKPAAGAHVTSPVTVSGTANVFEANVTVEVLDANGKVVGKTFTTASCGTGCRGTYSVDVTYKVAQEQPGTIVVHDDDAAGTGTPPHSVRIPVTLGP
jgi:Immunoglobulin-like domain of bacterial spore germination/Sporulation and spore germination